MPDDVGISPDLVKKHHASVPFSFMLMRSSVSRSVSV